MLTRFVLPLSLCLSSLLCAAQTPPVAAEQQNSSLSRAEVKLVQIGYRAYSNGSTIPLWAVMLGDTSRAEQIARNFPRLGPYALNATLWTHVDEEQAAPKWARTTYRRPRDIDEAVDWYKNPEAFKSRQQGDRSVLPSPFAQLDSATMNEVEFIIRYDDGSAKAYLYFGTSTDDAEKVLAALVDRK